METVTLNRTQKRQLSFLGEEIAHLNTKRFDDTRWTKCSVYKLINGEFAVGIAEVTQWQGERDRFTAETFKSLEELITFLEENFPRVAEEIAFKLDVKETMSQGPSGEIGTMMALQINGALNRLEDSKLFHMDIKSSTTAEIVVNEINAAITGLQAIKSTLSK